MKTLAIPDIAPLKARADAEYKKADEAFERVIAYRNECSNLLDNIQITTRDRRYLSDVWINANRHEGQYLREERRHRRRGDRIMQKYDRAVLKVVRAEKVLNNPELGAELLKQYEADNVDHAVWLTYANDPSDMFGETRARLEKTPVDKLEGV